LTTQQAGLNSQVTQDVSSINQLTQQIAALNPQIAEATASGQNAGTLQDQQGQLILNLSKLTDVSVTQGNNGVTLSTGNGSPLVVGSQSLTFQTTTGTDGNVHVLDKNGTDITSSLTGGDLGGTIQTRDVTIPGLSNQLDTLASEFGNAFNLAQSKGVDQNGNVGGDFFTLPTTVAGSAALIKMATTDPTAIAASSDGSAGSNKNVINFTNLQTAALGSGETPTATYSNLVYQVGNLTSNATAESSATTASLLQLNNQLSSVSGVSTDEEATNLISYQQAYQAAAQVVSTIQAMFTTTMNMMTA
jgi:flagellar hook-associated protein 1 FlgK